MLEGNFEHMSIYSICAHSCRCLGKDKSQKSILCFFFFFPQRRPQGNMVLIRIASLRCQSSLCRTVKTIRDVWLRRDQNRLQPETKHRNTSNLADRRLHWFVRIPVAAHTSKPLPNIEYNKYVCVCVCVSRTSTSHCYMGTHCSLNVPGLGLSW